MTTRNLSREELEQVQRLYRSVINDMKALAELEDREHTVSMSKNTILRSLRKTELAFDHNEQKNALKESIAVQKHQMLKIRAVLEEKISRVPDPYLRLALSLHYVDLMTWEQAALFIGGSATSRGLQQLAARHFEHV